MVRNVKSNMVTPGGGEGRGGGNWPAFLRIETFPCCQHRLPSRLSLLFFPLSFPLAVPLLSANIAVGQDASIHRMLAKTERGREGRAWIFVSCLRETMMQPGDGHSSHSGPGSRPPQIVT